MNQYVIAIDQGTTSTRAIVFDHSGNIVSSGKMEHEQIFPQAGWVEHDHTEIWNNTREVIAVDGGFISVSQGRVSILSEYARLASEMSVSDAEHELAEAQQRLDSGDFTDDDRRRFDRASAQLRAAQKAQ